MSPCTPLQSSKISPPPFNNNGLFAPQLPDLNIPFNEPEMEDLLSIFDNLSLILPSGVLKPNLSANFSKDVLDGILSLLQSFMPFLSLYSFFMPVLNLILCIIEVLCSIANPFKLIRALKRLFRNCIPEFLALFPALALIIMIISLLLLIITLIEYIIERILKILSLILENIQILSQAAVRADNDSILAITAKIGDLLCLLQNLFALFGVILVVIQVIEALLKVSFKIPPCDDSDGTDDGCCTPDVCPSFIKNNTTIFSTTGSFKYLNEAAIDSGLSLPAGFSPVLSIVREESWQFFDSNAMQDLQFNNITHAFDLPQGIQKIFFPSGVSYNSTTAPNTVPYTIDIRIFYNPTFFGRTDIKGARFVRIKDCIIVNAPVDGVHDYNNNYVSPTNGTLNIQGGSVFEDDGVTPISLNGFNQSNLNSFIHLAANVSSSTPILLPTDGYIYNNVEYTFKINHEVLFAHDLITLGCIPSLAESKNFINTTIALPLAINSQKLNAIVLPDLQGSIQCVLSAINTFKQGISIDSVNIFQNEITLCLNNLKNDTQNALNSVIEAGFDQYKSDFTIDSSIQFTTMPIKLSVTLAEGTGKNMATNIPKSIGSELASKIVATATFGQIGQFSYDGYGAFIANITSTTTGSGSVEVSFAGKLISILNNPSNINLSPSVTPKSLNYTFILSSALGGDEGKPRRDNEDVINIG